MTIIFLGICSTLPFLTFIIIRTFKSELKQKYVEGVVGSIYEEINTNKLFGLGYIIWFLLRRLAFAVIAVFLSNEAGVVHLIYLVI